uniref:PARP-type domain-containing protein n=1 Tax=viral metagenome TaxID=1070528 RepID=A0A6M3L4D6_9ZZZZ
MSKIFGKSATCAYCKKPIETLDYVVRGKLWKKFTGTGEVEARRWSIKLCWHVECWVEQGRTAADKAAGHRIEARGRPKSKLAEKDQAERLAIIRRRASVIQRIRRETERPFEEQDFNKVVHLGEMLEKLAVEIKAYGGVPESWMME